MKHIRFSNITTAFVIAATASIFASCGNKNISKYIPIPRDINASYSANFDSVFYDINGVSACDLHSLMVIQDGKVIYEKYGLGHTADELHILWSATKTFTATAVGFAWQDGLIDLDTPVITYLRDELPDTLTPQLQTLTMDHLLKMTSGWGTDVITERIRAHENFDAVQACLTSPFVREPGTHWRYNNMDTYLAGVVVQKVTGQTLEDYLRDKLFTPLGIDTLCYETDSRGFNTGAFGMHITTESLAKLGLFILQKGEWSGVQLLDSAWFEKATAVQINQYSDQLQTDLRETESLGDWRCGYCYQSWACHIPGSVRADGMWGQYAIVLPDKNAVVAMTTLCTDREAQLNAVWKHIYPHL